MCLGRWVRTMAAVCACALALPPVTPLALAQDRSATPVSPAESASSVKSAPGKPREAACPAGLRLRLSAPLALQGSLVLAEVRSARALEDVKGIWGGREAPFWREAASREAPRPADVPQTSLDHPAETALPETWRALAGVDLEKPPGAYRFTLTARARGGEPMSCSVLLRVRKGRFATERLRVDKQFSEPSVEQLLRANHERERLRAIYDGVTGERLWRGGFRLPLDGVDAGGNFGRRRILNGQPGSPHSGVDFPAAAGTPVHAAQRGRVALAEELFFSGNTVVLDHGLGIYTFYGHLETIAVHAGAVVEAGAELGTAGATGRVTGPHLHWGLTVLRARVDGLQLVKLLGKE